jgi:hypothetical protein
LDPTTTPNVYAFKCVAFPPANREHCESGIRDISDLFFGGCRVSQLARTVPHTGPFNACSEGSIALKTIVHDIENATGRDAIVKNQPDEPFSIFRAEQSFTMSSGKPVVLALPFRPPTTGCATDTRGS